MNELRRFHIAHYDARSQLESFTLPSYNNHHTIGWHGCLLIQSICEIYIYVVDSSDYELIFFKKNHVRFNKENDTYT